MRTKRRCISVGCGLVMTVLSLMVAAIAPEGVQHVEARCDIDHPQDCIVNTPPPFTRTVPTIRPVGSVVAPMSATICQPPAPNSPFATPGFRAQWQMGEGLTPNFWGPTYTVGFSEPYSDAAGGSRLVQYFDKGRMELANATTGKVTNGLLATELITGQLQLGDTTFERRTPANIPIAGDPDGGGPTYAALGGKGVPLLVPATTAVGTNVTAEVSATGDVIPGNAVTGSTQTTIALFDSITQHNVPQAFAQYRESAGVAAIGYAKSEPFWAMAKVAGQPRRVLMQVFERRVLTYTADNPTAYQVEMGNIGQHYYRWRYCGA